MCIGTTEVGNVCVMSCPASKRKYKNVRWAKKRKNYDETALGVRGGERMEAIKICAFLIALSLALFNQIKMQESHKSGELKDIIYHGQTAIILFVVAYGILSAA